MRDGTGSGLFSLLRAGPKSRRFNPIGGQRKGERVDFDTGSRPGPSGSGGSGSRPPGTSASAGEEFDYRDPIQSFVRATRGVLTQPADFFRGMVRQGDFVNPILYAVICSLFFAVVGGFLNMLNTIVTDTAGVGGAIAGFIGSIIFTPILVVIFLFIGAGIYHLLVLLFASPSNAGYEATFRVLGYGSAILVVSWVSALFNLIPFIGPIIGSLLGILIGVYAIVIQVLGIREVHSTTTGRAAAVVLLPTVVFFVIALLIVGAALLVIFGGQQG